MVSSALILFFSPLCLYCNCLNISFYFTNLMFSWAFSHWDSVCSLKFYFGNTVFCQTIFYYIAHIQLDKLCPESLIILIEWARILNVMWLHLQVIRELFSLGATVWRLSVTLHSLRENKESWTGALGLLWVQWGSAPHSDTEQFPFKFHSTQEGVHPISWMGNTLALCGVLLFWISGANTYI